MIKIPNLVIVPLLISLASAGSALAEDMDAASQDALEKTQDMLKDANLRNAAISKDAGAQKADQQVKSLGLNAADQQEVYQLASEIFGDMVKERAATRMKLMELMEQAKKNPSAFAGKLTPQQQEKLKALSNRIPAAASH